MSIKNIAQERNMYTQEPGISYYFPPFLLVRTYVDNVLYRSLNHIMISHIKIKRDFYRKHKETKEIIVDKIRYSMYKL